MDYKHITCPCCKKEVDIPLYKYSKGFDFNYSILINSIEEFFDLVDICPNCGYTELFDNGISEEMKVYVSSEEYRSVLNNPEIEAGLKRWILLAMLCELDENFTEAGIAYTKAYDYLELRNMEMDHRFIEKAASCFLAAADENTSFIDAILAVDSMRRDGDVEAATRFLGVIKETFNGELVDKLVGKEEIWLSIGEKEKRYLDI